MKNNNLEYVSFHFSIDIITKSDKDYKLQREEINNTLQEVFKQLLPDCHTVTKIMWPDI